MFLYSTVSTLKPDVIAELRTFFVLKTWIVLTDGGDSSHDFTELELVQDGRLTSSIETNLQRVSLDSDIQGIQGGPIITAYHQNTCRKRAQVSPEVAI